MTTERGRILVVDDEALNRQVLTRALEAQGYDVATVDDGRQALARLRAEQPPAFDVVLLDILMPELDGYQTLEQIKWDDGLRHLPVIMISAVDELDSVIRCIEMGAIDYLPKPFNAALLRARLTAALQGKRLRDLELAYLEQVGRVTAAAAAVEAGGFAPDSLDVVAARPDALGQLARVFGRMAREVLARGQRLRDEVQQLRIEIDAGRTARQVAEITESDFFRDLEAKVDRLRAELG